MKKCPYCAEEIQNEAIKCRHCNESLTETMMKPKKRWYIKTWFIILSLLLFAPLGIVLTWKNKSWSLVTKIILTVVFGIIFLSYIAGSNQESTVTDTQNSTKQTSVAQRANAAISLNTAFGLGDFTYTIKGIKTVKAIGNGFVGLTAQDGATFLMVEYQLKNDSNETKTVLTDDFKVTDYKNRTFRPSSNANTTYMMTHQNKDFIISQIQPGLSKKMVSVFEVPLDSITTKGLQLIVPEKGWGSREIVIKLN